ncbi:hypothetical protein WMF04_00615 [Sorangium sp. So ce260]|uniref:hypothetical protein n=1 Tax=Sorangium sp. So ce260 TaxID=3133291 RepID=UPI003F5DCC10
MSFAARDDLPSAPGIEDLGPLGSLAPHEGAVVRIPRSGNPFEPRPPLPTEDPAALRDAARLVSEGLVLRQRHNHGAQAALMTGWVEGALGPPRVVRSIGASEQLLWFDGAIVLLLADALTVACATGERLRALLARPVPPGLSPAPARYAYSPNDGPSQPGTLLGSMHLMDRYFPETFELYGTETGCWVRGVLQGAFETRFQMRPGGGIATAARHPDRFARASSFGEWQPGLREHDGLCAQLERFQASAALTKAVLDVDELIGGFRGQRGISIMAPLAASVIRERTASGIWSSPVHPYNGAWFIGWIENTAVRTGIYVDERGGVWASWQEPDDDEVQVRLVGTGVERWFERQIYLLGNGYASEATCRSEAALPPGLSLREDLSDAAAQVFVDEDAVWLVEECGIQRMSRRAPSVSDVLAIAGRFG